MVYIHIYMYLKDSIYYGMLYTFITNSTFMRSSSYRVILITNDF